MNIFIPYPNTLQTATALDYRRLNKQIIECAQMISAITGATTAWAHHPCTLMYAPHLEWLTWYRNTLIAYRQKSPPPLEPKRPPFIGWAHLHNVHKARLYQKDRVHYAQFAQFDHYAIYNIYIVADYELRYIDGRLIEKIPYLSDTHNLI